MCVHSKGLSAQNHTDVGNVQAPEGGRHSRVLCGWGRQRDSADLLRDHGGHMPHTGWGGLRTQQSCHLGIYLNLWEVSVWMDV